MTECLICCLPLLDSIKRLDCCEKTVHVVDIVKTGQERCPFCRAEVKVPAKYRRRLGRAKRELLSHITDPEVVIDLRKYNLTASQADLVVRRVVKQMRS